MRSNRFIDFMESLAHGALAVAYMMVALIFVGGLLAYVHISCFIDNRILKRFKKNEKS